MLRKIKVYGELADFLGWKEQEALVNNIPDVMKFILCNHPEAESYMKNKYLLRKLLYIDSKGNLKKRTKLYNKIS